MKKSDIEKMFDAVNKVKNTGLSKSAEVWIDPEKLLDKLTADINYLTGELWKTKAELKDVKDALEYYARREDCGDVARKVLGK